MRRLIGFVALLLAASCGGGPTEIVLVINTNIPEIDGLRVDVTFPRGGTSGSDADLTAQPAPRRLVLVHDAGPLGPVMVRVHGLQGATEIVMVERALTFEAGETLTLEILLSADCQALSCAARTSCGNDGRCRPTEVQPCEYVGRTCAGPEDAGLGLDAGVGDADAGAPDAGGDAGLDLDGGPECNICGVAERHLPGDVVRPSGCGLPVDVTVAGPSGDLAPMGASGRYLLPQTGTYTVTIHDTSTGCINSRAISVPAPISIGDPGGVAPDELRDLDARVDTAFVAGRRGPFAVDASAWFDLRDGVIGGDSMAPENQRAVAVVDGVAFFGPAQNEGAIHLIDTAAPFDTSNHWRIDLPSGDHRVHAMDSRVGHLAPIALATRAGVLIVDDPTGSPSVDSRSSYEANGWVAVGEVEHDPLGALWAGDNRDLINRHVRGGGDVLNNRSDVRRPGFLGDVNAAVVPDDGATSPLLWLCGSAAVARFDFSDMDWMDQSDLPDETAQWTGACNDMATSVGGDIWVASGPDGLVRLDDSATSRAVLTTSTGLPPGFQVDFVAVASDATVRQVWALDATAHVMLRFEADPLP